MALTPRDYAPNPYLAYVRFKVRGEIITLRHGRPDALLGFSYTRTTDNAGNVATINLIDKDKDRLEPMFVGLDTEPVYFQYGYTEGRLSPWYSAVVTEYTPEYVVEGTKINVNMVTQGLMGTLGEERKKTVAWTEKRIDEIVAEIASQRGWDTEIDETEEVPDNPWMEKSEVGPKQFTQQNLTDEQFIVQVLLPRAIRKSDGVGGYAFWFDDTDGKTKIHFHPPRMDAAPVKTYHFMFDKMSEVVSYSPMMTPMIAKSFGAGVVGLPFMDVRTGEYKVVEIHDSNTPEKVLLGGPLSLVEAPKNERQHAIPLRVVADEDQAKQMAKAAFMQMYNATFGASLTIVGDPTLKPFSVIRVIFVHKEGKVHYTSGLWLVQQIKDTISAGKYLSQLTLTRTGYREDAGIEGTQGTGKVNA